MEKTVIAKYGMAASVAILGYTCLFYAINPRLMLSPWVQYASIGLLLVFIVLALNNIQAKQTGSLPFMQALRIGFAVYVIASLIYWIFYYILITHINPDLIELQRQMQLEALDTAAKNPLLGKSFKEAELTSLREQINTQDMSMHLSDIFFATARSAFAGFLLSLCVAYIRKRE